MLASELGKGTRTPRLVTLQEVADMLRLSPHTIRSMVRQRRLVPVRICRRLLFDLTEIEQLVSRASGGCAEASAKAS